MSYFPTLSKLVPVELIKFLDKFNHFVLLI
nr:MAG TPA: hypothetical protein [Caudoviricetes sp.]